MLEIRNITKIYRSKKGESVRALDNVSIQFPESGMVFLLGKSGSGKSTLLNVIGGLDSYDSGEFVIMGKSSADFVGSDFDAYRNTFIGFIFQEYNVLDDFTVGANIGLALELQGKKATNEAVNAILEKVDLVGYAGRKPNELSGGQKQRVAIARALVKDPQIIMADEPTGALDSATGKQIFDTLKELSREKLVLVVSHDRDFAERYADRIIELSDGHIIDDVIKEDGESTAEHVGVHRVSDTVLRINSGYVLTQKDLEMINAYLANAKEDVILSSDRRVNAEFAAATDTGEKKGAGGFRKTDPAKIRTKKYEKEKTRFIRSRLPMKNAVKMGASGLKHKKFRLVMTILLSFISFAMFGLADTMAAYDQITSATSSVLDSNVRNASVTLGVRYTYQYGDNDPYTYYNTQAMNDDDIAWLRAETGLAFVPVYNGSSWVGFGSGIQMSTFMPAYQGHTNMQAFTATMSGFVELDEASLRETGFIVTGRMPQSENEIVITEFMYRQFNEYGFKNELITPEESIKEGSVTMSTDGAASSIIGKHLSFGKGEWNDNKPLTHDLEIVGVIDTRFDYERYAQFLPTDDPVQQEDDGEILTYVLSSELEHELTYGFHTLGFMTKAGITAYSTDAGNEILGTHMGLMDGFLSLRLVDGDRVVTSYDFVADSAKLKKLGDIVWRDGRTNGTLGKNEILVSEQLLEALVQDELAVTLNDARLNALIELCGGEEIWQLTDSDPENLPRNLLERYHASFAVSYIKETLASKSAVRTLIESDMESEGFVGSAEEFWIRRWLVEGNGDYPGFVWDSELEEDIKVKSYWDFSSQEYLIALKPWIEDFFGIELHEGVELYEISNFATFLNRFYENERTVKVRADELRWILTDYYVRLDVEQNELWKNQAMIDLLIENGQYASNKTVWAALGEQQRDMMINFCRNYYIYDWQFGEYYNSVHKPLYTESEFITLAGETLLRMSGLDREQLLNNLAAKLMLINHQDGEETEVDGFSFTIAGFFQDSQKVVGTVVSDTLYDYYITRLDEENKEMKGDTDYREEYAEHEEGLWTFAIAPMPKDREVVRKLMELHYAEEGEGLDLKFELNNAVMSTLGTFDDMIEVLAQVFLWVGLGFAVFSAFLLMNFIATSISYKKREIGILRAVGARSSDVFKIFFSESAIIALINFFFAVAASLTTVIILNNYMRKQGINITLLNFGVRQVILMLGISIIVALIASFLPVWNIARRKPVDAIKDR